MQAIGRPPQRAPDGAPFHCERHLPEQTTLYHFVQPHAASFIAHTEASTGSELPWFIKDEFDATLECGNLAHGFPMLRCGDCGHDKLLAFGCERRGFCPSCGARRMSQKAAHPVDHGTPHVPVRQWVLSLPIPLRMLFAAQPELVTPVLQVVPRVAMCHLLAGGAPTGACRIRTTQRRKRQGQGIQAGKRRPRWSFERPLEGPTRLDQPLQARDVLVFTGDLTQLGLKVDYAVAYPLDSAALDAEATPRRTPAGSTSACR